MSAAVAAVFAVRGLTKGFALPLGFALVIATGFLVASIFQTECYRRWRQGRARARAVALVQRLPPIEERSRVVVDVPDLAAATGHSDPCDSGPEVRRREIS